MRENKIAKLSIFVLLITIIAISLVAGTYAKYTSTATGAATATVAKWSIKTNGTEIATDTPTTVAFDLFKTINDTLDENDETDVANERIAPGTTGSFDLAIENTSEVTAEYTISYSVTNTSGVPLQYSTNGTEWTSDLTTLNVGTTRIEMGASATSNPIYWKWVYDGDSELDTGLGIDAQTTAPTVTVEATIVVTQVD